MVYGLRLKFLGVGFRVTVRVSSLGFRVWGLEIWN